MTAGIELWCKMTSTAAARAVKTGIFDDFSIFNRRLQRQSILKPQLFSPDTTNDGTNDLLQLHAEHTGTASALEETSQQLPLEKASPSMSPISAGMLVKNKLSPIHHSPTVQDALSALPAIIHHLAQQPAQNTQPNLPNIREAGMASHAPEKLLTKSVPTSAINAIHQVDLALPSPRVTQRQSSRTHLQQTLAPWRHDQTFHLMKVWDHKPGAKDQIQMTRLRLLRRLILGRIAAIMPRLLPATS